MNRITLPITPQFGVALVLCALVGVLCGAAVGQDQGAPRDGPAGQPRVATSIAVTASIVADVAVWSQRAFAYYRTPSGAGATPGPEEPQRFRLVAEGVTVELVPLGAGVPSEPPASVTDPAEQPREGSATPPPSVPGDATDSGAVKPSSAPTASESLPPAGARQTLSALRQYGLALDLAGANDDAGRQVTRLFVPSDGSWTPLSLPAPVTTEVPVGESGSVDMNWPDDAPRFFLEQQGPDTYRKVELAEKEGYSVSAAPKPSGANYLVSLSMTKNALVGGKYDEQIGAYVGQPTVVKTVCTTGIPVVPGNMTVVTWRVPGGDAGGLGAAFAQWGLSSYGTLAAPLHRSVGRPGGVSGTALRVTLQLAGDQPVAAADSSPRTSETVVSDPLTVHVTGDVVSMPAQVAIQTKVYELRIGGDGWREMIGAGDPVTVIAKLADEGKARVMSEPVIVSQDGMPATITIAVRGSGDDSQADATDVESSADLGQSLTFTPRIGPNGELTLTVECSFNRLAAMLVSPDGGRSSIPLVMTLQLNAVAETKDGKAFLLRGLTSLKQSFDAQGNAVPGDPVETIIVVTPRIVTDAETGINAITLTGARLMAPRITTGSDTLAAPPPAGGATTPGR